MNKLTPREPTPVADEPVTRGHCSAMRQPGGCPLHNLECGYPECDTRPAAAPSERGEHPPLPESEYGLCYFDEGGTHELWERGYTADQMRAYVDADRAQRVPLTDEQIELLIDNSDGRWHDGEFRIDAQDLTKLLRSAHGIGKP